MSGLLPYGSPWEGTRGTRGLFGLSSLASFLVHVLLYGFQHIRGSVLRVAKAAVLHFC